MGLKRGCGMVWTALAVGFLALAGVLAWLVLSGVAFWSAVGGALVVGAAVTVAVLAVFFVGLVLFSVDDSRGAA